MDKMNMTTSEKYIFYEDVKFLDPCGDFILINGKGNNDKMGNYWFELFDESNYPKVGRKYIVTADIKNSKIPFGRALVCKISGPISMFKEV